ncbi:MAG: carboxypeptidase-like regulatory domain-containing protein [Chlorobiota bacterium]
MRTWKLATAALIAVLLSACVKHPSEPKEPPPSSHPDSCCNTLLIVLPYDSASGTPVVGASVRVQQAQGSYSETKVTQQNGASFPKLCPGTYFLRISHEHCSVRELSIALECEDTVELRIPLVCEERDSDTCCRGVITVRVYDSLQAKPLRDAIVRLWEQGKLVETRPVHDGSAAFDGLCKGEYVIEVTAEEYQPREIRIYLPCNDRVEARVGLLPKHQECCEGMVAVIIQDSVSAQRIRGARVWLWQNGRLITQQETGADGVARFTRLCQGPYGISVHADGYRPKEFELTLGCNQAIERHVLLPRRP